MPDSARCRFGKNFLVEPSGTKLADEELRLLEWLQPSAIMLRKRNFLEGADYSEWLTAYETLLSQCRQVIEHESLIVSIDHEGGRVIRPPEPITRFPYAARWGDSSAAVATAMSEELRSLGVNVNFAPVADIHSNPENPVINERAFGRTPEDVSRRAVEFALALQNGGIAPCAKHFPGHGDTKVDSHWELPVVDLSLQELRNRELRPFQALIDAGVQMIMTAHIVFPQIDAENKATVSRKILIDILREEMGFKGVVIADALGMAAAVDTLTQRQTVAKAINAGLDIFLVAGDGVGISDAVNMAKLMEEAVAYGEVEPSVIEASQHRVDSFCKLLPQYSVQALSSEVLEQNRLLCEKLSQSQLWSSEFTLSLPGFE